MQAETKYFFKFTESFNDSGTVWYTIQVHTKGEEQEPIIFKSRYSEMRQVHDRCASTSFKNDLPDFPQKKLLGATKQQFIQKRKKELENYYNTLAKTIDIEKLKDLYKFIQSHRKVKKPAPKASKGLDEAGKLETKVKKQTSLRTQFQAIYNEIVAQLIDTTEDTYPHEGYEGSSKKFQSHIENIKPKDSKILGSSIEGLQTNDEDFWAVTFMDNYEDFMNKTLQIKEEFEAIEGEIRKKNGDVTIVIK